MPDRARGFSLVELLIVVAIILIIAAVGIPNFLRSKIAANQASAVGSLRLVSTAEVSYSTTYNNGYSTTLAALGPPANAGDQPTSTAAGLIDNILASGAKSGYTFTYSAGPPDSTGRVGAYNITGVPMNYLTGTFSYYTDQSGVIRQNPSATAGSSDSPIN